MIVTPYSGASLHYKVAYIMFRILFVLFLLIPLIELYFLIQVGEVIGAGWTIFFVLATAVIGASLIRAQGASTLLRAQANLQQGSLPALEMLEGIALAMSGVMLLIPGFFTDTLGFILLIPIFRRALIKPLLNKGQFTMRGHTMYSHRNSDDSTIIEGEIVDRDDHEQLK